MGFVKETPALAAALGAIEGIQRVTRGWPKDFEKLPCAAITLAGDAPADYRDDGRRITELEYYIRVFTDQAVQRDGLCDAVDSVMAAHGYECTFRWEDDSADVRQTVMRYRKYC